MIFWVICGLLLWLLLLPLCCQTETKQAHRTLLTHHLGSCSSSSSICNNCISQFLLIHYSYSEHLKLVLALTLSQKKLWIVSIYLLAFTVFSIRRILCVWFCQLFLSISTCIAFILTVSAWISLKCFMTIFFIIFCFINGLNTRQFITPMLIPPSMDNAKTEGTSKVSDWSVSPLLTSF